MLRWAPILLGIIACSSMFVMGGPGSSVGSLVATIVVLILLAAFVLEAAGGFLGRHRRGRVGKDDDPPDSPKPSNPPESPHSAGDGSDADGGPVSAVRPSLRAGNRGSDAPSRP